MTILQHVVNQPVHFQNQRDNNCIIISFVETFYVRKSNVVDAGSLILHMACTLHGMSRYECDKKQSGVNIASILTANTFTAGVSLTVVPDSMTKELAKVPTLSVLMR